MPVLSSWIQIQVVDELSAYECMERVLGSKPVPSAVFCAGDIFAIGAMKCARDYGDTVPEDISFIGNR